VHRHMLGSCFEDNVRAGSHSGANGGDGNPDFL
jgi:hypothetical protein